MRLIIGGAYQGKLEFASKYNITKDDVIDYSKDDVDKFDKHCLYHFELWVKKMIELGRDPLKYLDDNEYQFVDKVIIVEDIFCGLVPVDGDLRDYRESLGRVVQKIAKNAISVERVVAGLGQRIK